MNYAELHLLLNHFPIIGTIVGLGLFLVSFVGKNDDLRRGSYIVFVAIALIWCVRRFASKAPRRCVAFIVVYGSDRRPCPGRTVAISEDFASGALERIGRPAFFASDGGPDGKNREYWR